MAHSIFKEESIRSNRYHDATPGGVDRLEQLMEDRSDLHQIRLLHWGRVIADITYGPTRAVNDSRRRAKQLVIYDRRGCGNIFRWATTRSLTARLHNASEPTEKYAIARLRAVPAARGKRAFSPKIAARNENETLRRRQGRYREIRNYAPGAIRQKNHTEDNPPGKIYATKRTHSGNTSTTTQIKKKPMREPPFGKANTHRTRKDERCAVKEKPYLRNALYCG